MNDLLRRMLRDSANLHSRENRRCKNNESGNSEKSKKEQNRRDSNMRDSNRRDSDRRVRNLSNLDGRCR